MDKGCFNCTNVAFDIEKGLYCKNENCLKISENQEDLQKLRDVEDALYKRISGYEYEETEVIATKDGKPLKIRKTKKHIPPDVNAIALFLKINFSEKYR